MESDKAVQIQHDDSILFFLQFTRSGDTESNRPDSFRRGKYEFFLKGSTGATDHIHTGEDLFIGDLVMQSLERTFPKRGNSAFLSALGKFFHLGDYMISFFNTPSNSVLFVIFKFNKGFLTGFTAGNIQRPGIGNQAFVLSFPESRVNFFPLAGFSVHLVDRFGIRDALKLIPTKGKHFPKHGAFRLHFLCKSVVGILDFPNRSFLNHFIIHVYIPLS